MNFSQVRGFNAYAMFSAKIREAANGKAAGDASPLGKDAVSGETGVERESSSFIEVYSEPVDTVTISEPARKASDALMALRVKNSAAFDAPDKQTSLIELRENTPHTELREWIRTAGRTAGMLSGGFSRSIPGSVMNEALRGSGITARDDEEFTVSVNVLSTVNVTSRSAEKAKAIQDLLNSTPGGINWGLLLTKLPPQ